MATLAIYRVLVDANQREHRRPLGLREPLPILGGLPHQPGPVLWSWDVAVVGGPGPAQRTGTPAPDAPLLQKVAG